LGTTQGTAEPENQRDTEKNEFIHAEGEKADRTERLVLAIYCRIVEKEESDSSWRCTANAQKQRHASCMNRVCLARFW